MCGGAPLLLPHVAAPLGNGRNAECAAGPSVMTDAMYNYMQAQVSGKCMQEGRGCDPAVRLHMPSRPPHAAAATTRQECVAACASPSPADLELGLPPGCLHRRAATIKTTWAWRSHAGWVTSSCCPSPPSPQASATWERTASTTRRCRRTRQRRCCADALLRTPATHSVSEGCLLSRPVPA